jgi:hypothetical protein
MIGFVSLLWILVFIPLTICLSYFLLGIVSLVMGIKEKSSLKVKSGAKTIAFSTIAFIGTIFIWVWFTDFSLRDLVNIF